MNINDPKIPTVKFTQPSGNYERYVVRTYLNKVVKAKLFPYTPEGYKEAEIYLKEYLDKKRKNQILKKKDKVHGGAATKRYTNKELKFFYVYPATGRTYCYTVIYLDDKKHTLSINHRGFHKIFNMQLERYRNHYKLDLSDKDINERIENTRGALCRQYRKLCKEHGFKFYS